MLFRSSAWICVFSSQQSTKACSGGLRYRPTMSSSSHCHIVETGNESHRFLHSSAVAKKRIKAREQARRADKNPPADGVI